MKIVFSIDDNHALNMKLADLFDRYDVKATFFINIQPTKHHTGMDSSQIIDLYNRGHEIAAHTMSHKILPHQIRSQRAYELITSRKCLETLLGEPVTGFSYPKGQYTEKVIAQVIGAGYTYARTVGEGNIICCMHEGSFITDYHAFRLRPTVQIYNSSLRRYLRIKQNLVNMKGMYSWFGGWKKSAIKFIKRNEGTVHIWGHSWEIEKQGLWDELEDLLKFIQDGGYRTMTLKEAIGDKNV